MLLLTILVAVKEVAGRPEPELGESARAPRDSGCVHADRPVVEESDV